MKELLDLARLLRRLLFFSAGAILVLGGTVAALFLAERRAELRPDGAGGVEDADHRFVVHDLMIGMQIGERRNEQTHRARAPQVMHECVAEPMPRSLNDAYVSLRRISAI